MKLVNLLDCAVVLHALVKAERNFATGRRIHIAKNSCTMLTARPGMDTDEDGGSDQELTDLLGAPHDATTSDQDHAGDRGNLEIGGEHRTRER